MILESEVEEAPGGMAGARGWDRHLPGPRWHLGCHGGGDSRCDNQWGKVWPSGGEVGVAQEGGGQPHC